MKKKLLILVLFLFLLCGCDATVNIEITENTIKEEISINDSPNGYYDTNQKLLDLYRDNIPAFSTTVIEDESPDSKIKGVNYYNKSVSNNESGFIFKYDYNFKLKDYQKASSVKSAFKSFTIDNIKKDKTIRISSDSAGLRYFNNYPNLENVTVNIKTDYEVKENNADIVNGNVYTWKFNKDTKKSIYMLLGEKEKEKTEQKVVKTEKVAKKKSFLDKHPVLCAIIGLVILFLVMWILSKLKIKG